MSYIHQNSIESDLVKNIEDWEYSGYSNYVQLKSTALIRNKKIHETTLSPNSSQPFQEILW